MCCEGKGNRRLVQSRKGGALIGKIGHQVNNLSIAILTVGSFELQLAFYWIKLEICQDYSVCAYGEQSLPVDRG